jgi:hypothetical protein
LIVFLDSSALAKRYLEEDGSDRVAELWAAATTVGISTLCPIEVVSALTRQRRENRMNMAQYALARASLFEDVDGVSVLALTAEVVSRAIELIEEAWPLRALDALHVASAMHWSADLFVSADRRQCAAARGAGLQVEELTP